MRHRPQIIIDCGSTKCDLAVLGGDQDDIYTVAGFNPALEGTACPQWELDLRDVDTSTPYDIYYYGSGVVSEIHRDRIRAFLHALFPCSSVVSIESDLLAAARSTLARQDGIICILGTGSNSGIYTGGVLSDVIPAFGPVLGNEGSGSHLGKIILQEYYYRRMPQDVQLQFESRYHPNRQSLLKSIYKGDNMAKTLGGYARFLQSDLDISWKNGILAKAFDIFIENRILPYTNYQDMKLSFVGSIAYFYTDMLTERLAVYHLSPELIVRSPISGLIDFHRKTETNTQ